MRFKDFANKKIAGEVYAQTLKGFEAFVRAEIVREFSTIKWSIGEIVYQDYSFEIALISFENEKNKNDSGMLIVHENELFGLIHSTESQKHPFALAHKSGVHKLRSLDEREMLKAINIVGKAFDKSRTKKSKEILKEKIVKLKNDFRHETKMENIQEMNSFTKDRI